MATALLLAEQSNAAGTGALFAGSAVVMFLIGLFVLASIFWIWMLIDRLVRNMPPMEKLVWLLVIFFCTCWGRSCIFSSGAQRRPWLEAGRLDAADESDHAAPARAGWLSRRLCRIWGSFGGNGSADLD
jgi:hypothetical protein